MDAVEEDEKDNSKMSKSLNIHYSNVLFRPMSYFLKAHGQQLYLNVWSYVPPILSLFTKLAHNSKYSTNPHPCVCLQIIGKRHLIYSKGFGLFNQGMYKKSPKFKPVLYAHRFSQFPSLPTYFSTNLFMLYKCITWA